MPDNSASEFGNPQAITHMIDTMRKGQLDIKYANNPVKINWKLGEGGTKTVYDVLIDNNSWALAVPNTVDSLQVMIEKWKVALQEPANTEIVRNLGLYTNSVCESLPVNINGVLFNVLKMRRYQDLPYPVMDGKDPYASTVKGSILPATLDNDTFEELMSSTVPDMQTLIENGLRVGVDAISICLIDGKPRIFLSDLGSMRVKPFTEDRVPLVVREYSSHAYSAFIQGLTEEEYQQHKAFFGDELFRFSNPNNLKNKLGERVQKKLVDNVDE